MPKQSAGILLYKIENEKLKIFLVHPGGPYFKYKDYGAWSIPKGEFTANEDALVAAQREFEEETGQQIEGIFIPLGSIKQKGGKEVYAWAVEGDINADAIVSNTFKMEYPYKSGKWMEVPEVDAAGWFNVADAQLKINPAQILFINKLEQYIFSAT